jgi:hypothetical protein
VIHHLDDARVDRLLDAAAQALAPGGRLVTIDPALAPGQHPLARWFIRRDRGVHMRSPAAYRDLARRRFGAVTLAVRHDLARVPYTHVILECREPVHPGPRR